VANSNNMVFILASKEQVQPVNIALSDDFLHDILIGGRNYLCGFQAEIFQMKYSCFKI
jgi:hypothetical protein